MLSWLRQLFAPAPAPPRPTVEALLAQVHAALAPGMAWDSDCAQRWMAALDLLCMEYQGAFEERSPGLRAEVARWYAEHPLEVVWSRDYRFRVVDPMVSIDEALVGEESLRLRPWATLLRSFEIRAGEANVFHHGCDLAAVLSLLEDPYMPGQLHRFSLPRVEDYSEGEIEALVATLCGDPRFAALGHLSLATSAPLQPRHLERLAAAPWAARLCTLDLTEVMIDWTSAQRCAGLRALGGFRGLTHLVLYNDVDEASEVEALLEAPLGALTHLSLGQGPRSAAALDLLATTRSLPKLQELCFGGGPPRTDPAWDRALGASFPIYLHGQRVTAEYPRRA